MTAIVAVLLAGGQARRMGGGDKCLRPIAGRPILAHILDRLRPQVDAIAINANGDPARFAEFGLEVVGDSVAGFPGPLAGVLAGLDWAATRHAAALDMVSVPCDGPFLPHDFVARLVAGRDAAGAEMACAASAGQAHPVAALWPVRLRDDLRRALTIEGIRKVDAWTGRHRLAQVPFSDEPVDPFFNANEPRDLMEAERLLKLAP